MNYYIYAQFVMNFGMPVLCHSDMPSLCHSDMPVLCHSDMAVFMT